MARTALWTFAHHALSPRFHEDPVGFVATLDGPRAARMLEDAWAWALTSAGEASPTRPPLAYDITRPRPGLAVVAMTLRDVTATGEPWAIRFIVREPDPGAANGYSRMFLLEHDAYLTETSGGPAAMVCESCADGRHANFGKSLSPEDFAGFDDFVIATLRAQASSS